MRTEIIVILDRSGSMSSIQSDVVGGFNAFVKEQKAQRGAARMTLVQFDNNYELNYEALSLNKVPKLEFSPRGGTALFDAIGRTLVEQGKRIKEEDWADLVIVNIITDGEENQSREFTSLSVKGLTSAYEDKGWKFIFMAANQDAFAAAQSYGIRGGLVGNFEASTVGVSTAYRCASSTVTSLRSGATISSLVTQE